MNPSPLGRNSTRSHLSSSPRPAGEVLIGNTLFVLERNALVEIDVDEAEVAYRYQVPGALFPNDIAADASGNLYISESNRNVLYRFADDECQVWLSGEEVSAPNGMLFDGQQLVFGNNGDNSLKRVDLETGEVETIVRLGPGIIDGIELDGRGNYLVSHFGGRLYCVTPAGEPTTLLDTRARGVTLASFGYVPELGLLVIPTLQSNRTGPALRSFLWNLVSARIGPPSQIEQRESVLAWVPAMITWKAVLFGGVVLAVAGCGGKAGPRPNVILITLDTFRADRLGVLGNPGGLTPSLDALAQEAALFANAITPIGTTHPSHASMVRPCKELKVSTFLW
ncbi:MAG: sulfatase-like hydrolase/transferase [Planctomycetota bacterium]